MLPIYLSRKANDYIAFRKIAFLTCMASFAFFLFVVTEINEETPYGLAINIVTAYVFVHSFVITVFYLFYTNLPSKKTQNQLIFYFLRLNEWVTAFALVAIIAGVHLVIINGLFFAGG